MSKNKQKKSGGAAAKVTDVILTLALLCGVGYGCFYVYANGVKINQETTYQETAVQPTSEEPTEEPGIVYDAAEIPNTEVHQGPLILVNNTVPCDTGESGLTSLYDAKLAADSHSFGVRDADVLVQEKMCDAAVAMFDGCYEATGDDNILVLSAYRSKDKQKELYDADLAETGLDHSERVAKPGFSEHQTGWCFDVSLASGEDYDGTGTYAWITENCAKYGFILRYPEGLVSKTGIQYEPWHYRYVGVPHASIIMNNDLCLEDYIELVKSYPYDGEHMRVIDYDGKIYEIYYYGEDTANDSTMVPVPNGMDYTVFGNNLDGFIVTVDTGETDDGGASEEEPDPVEELTEAEEPTEAEEE